MHNYIFLQFEQTPMSLFGPMWESFKWIDKSSWEIYHGSKEYYGI